MRTACGIAASTSGRWQRAFALLLVCAPFVLASPGAGADSFTPSDVALALSPGTSATIAKTLALDAAPARADIEIAIDTTGSMGPAIAQAKADAAAIVSSVRAKITDAQFAVVEFKDSGDTPEYFVHQPLTSDVGSVQAAINGLSAGGGGDAPEALNLVFRNSYTPLTGGAIGWRAKTRKFVVVIGDAEPHGAGTAGFAGCADTSADPHGYNTATELAGMKANERTLLMVRQAEAYTSTSLACYESLAAGAYPVGAAVDGIGDLGDKIVALVEESAKKLSEVTFAVSPASFSSWVAFTPASFGGTGSALTAPLKLSFKETITVPPATALGLYSFQVKTVVDGAERAAVQNVTVDVRRQATSSLTLTSDHTGRPAGIAAVPIAALPPSRLSLLFSNLASAPAGSIPAGSIPAGSIPAGSIPAGSIPAGSIPAGSIPAGSIPAGSIPAGSIPPTILFGQIGLGATPAGSIPAGSIGLRRILLSSIPLSNPALGASWTTVLAGTSLDGRPLNALTLADVAGDAVALDRLNAVRLRDVVLGGGLFGGVRYASLLLGGAKLNQLPPPGGATTWCDALVAGGGSCAGLDLTQNTVLGVELAGQLGGTDIGSIPAGSIPAGSIPAGSIPAGSINLPATRFAAVPLSDLQPLSDVVNCAVMPDCTVAGKTLADAYAVSAIQPTATLAVLLAALPLAHPARSITIGEIVAATLLVSDFPWEAASLQGLQDVAGTGADARYHVDFELDCSVATSFTAIAVELPKGSFPVRGSSSVAYAGGNAVAANDPAAPDDARPFRFVWSAFPSGACPTTGIRHVKLTFLAYQGLGLGKQVAAASVTANGVRQEVANQAPIVVTENHEQNDDPGTAPTIAKDTLLVQHIAHSGDVDFVRFPIDGLPAFTRVTAHLDVPDGADFDLAIGKPEAPTFLSAPAGSIPAGSIPVEDGGLVLDNSLAALAPETLADVPAATPAGSIPAGSIPAGSISANRGSVGERATVTLTGESGFLTIGVSGYNGSFSDEPGVLRIEVTPPPALPPCAPRQFPNATPAANVLPASLDPATKTIFIVNRQRLVAMYGETSTNALLASLSAPATLPARPEVKGAVLEVDGSEAVRNAYGAWDAAPCSVPAANAVVRAINDVVAGYRSALGDLTYVVLLGTDEAIPFHRQPDRTAISPELDETSDLEFTTSGLTNGNALYASAAQNTVLTDGAYGAVTQFEWLGRDLPLAQLSVARLIETPADMLAQVQQYVDPIVDGKLDPTSATTTGYDFLTEGATDISTALAANFAGISQTDLLPPVVPGWDRVALLGNFFNAAVIPSIGALNAHYSHYLAQPASLASGMVSTADVPGSPALAARILFTMGCHGGLNVPDTLGGSAPRLQDWAQAYAQARAAVYVANTGFGYGEMTPGLSGLSERLMALFAARLNSDGGSIGEQWAAALADYYLTAGNYDVYDEKVMIEATFYGLPFYHFGKPGTGSPAPAPPALTPDGSVEIASVTLTPGAVENAVGDGSGRSFWSSDGETDDTLYRPVQPLTVTDVSVGGKRARGAFITALQTSDHAGQKPVQAYPAIDLRANEPPPGFPNIFWPANVVSLVRTSLFGDERAALAVSGQFRPDGPGAMTGVQRNVVSLTAEVAYSNSADNVPPEITHVGAVMTDASTATVFVRAHDAAGALGKVAALVNDGNGWKYVSLAPAGGDLYTGVASVLVKAPEVLAQARDLAGLVGFSANKGFNFTARVDDTDPEIRLQSPLPRAIYLLNQQVAADYGCSDAGGVASCIGTVADGAAIDTSTAGNHEFRVTTTDVSGNVTTEVVPYEVRFTFAGFYEPVKNRPTVNVANAGRSVPLKWSLKDAGGAFHRELSAITAISSSRIKCPSAAADPVADTVAVADPALKYDLTAEQYVFPWKTEKTWAGTCRRLMVGLADNTVQTADFSFN